MSIIDGKSLGRMLLDAGIIPPDCRRVIIDVPCEGVVVMYIEQFGDDRLLDIDWGNIVPEIVVKKTEREPQEPQPPSNTWRGARYGQDA